MSQSDVTEMLARKAVRAADAGGGSFEDLTGDPADNTNLVALMDTRAAAAAAALVASAPSALNTLDELAAALGDDASFAATVTALLGQKAAAPIVYRVTNADIRTAQTLGDSPELIIPAADLTAATWYELFAVLFMSSSSAAGVQVALHYTGTGGSIKAGLEASLTGPTAIDRRPLTAFDNSPSTILTVSSTNVPVLIRGLFYSGSVKGDLSFRHLKVTSGNSTVESGSFLSLAKCSPVIPA